MGKSEIKTAIVKLRCLGFLGGFVGVHVVDDEEPTGVEFQPAEGGFDLKGLFFFVLLGEIQDGAFFAKATKPTGGGEVAVEGLGGVGCD